ncbi:Ras association domain-containing protein 5 [Halotydeus destructor]|nr:Ras association domain-containing protein 5 [Halotydeus destructor]
MSGKKEAVSHPLQHALTPPLSPEPVSRRASSPSTSSSTPSPSGSNVRNSVIGNLNNWISDLNLSMNNLSPSALFGNLSLSNPFNRKNRSKSGISSPLASPRSVPRSKSESLAKINARQYELSDENPVAKFLNGTIKPTLKPKELIELASFGFVEVDAVERGVGHRFNPHQLVNPTWCDSCGEFMWTAGTFTNSVSNNPNLPFQSLQCDNCKYICHARCRKLVRIDCQGQNECRTLLEPPAQEPSSLSPLFMDRSVIEDKISKYNSRLKNKGSGLGMFTCEDGTFRGFIRVHLNLTRPINVIAGTRPPSIYDIIKEDEEAAAASRKTLTSFYMPRDTVKNIHITSESTSLEVIKSMLKKFKVVDNPQKFALYQSFPETDADKVTVNVLKRIGDQDKPLRIALDWLDSDEKRFVLQENDTADINWHAFALPELQNFLLILDKEEEEYANLIRDRYLWFKNEMNQVLNVKMIQSEGVLV